MTTHGSWFRILLLFIMLSTAARAFSSKSINVARSVARFSGVQSTNTIRNMSTGEPDTSVVVTCQEKIQAALGTDEVKVTGAYDDPNGSHISIEVVSSKFEGKRAVQRQQMVYKAIWEELQGPVHAVDAMICKTPDEA